MKKRLTVFLLIAVLVMANLSACGSTAQTATTTETAAVSSAKEEAAAPETQAPAASETETETPKAAETAAPAETEEAQDTKEPEQTQAASAQSESEEAEAQVEEIEIPENVEKLDASGLLLNGGLMGGLKPVEEAPEAEDMDAETQEKMDRAMRDYKASGKTLLQNKAKSFYYYSQMTDDEQAMYDAMMLICEDPASEEVYSKAVISLDPTSYDFAEEFYTAYYGMLYDHAELFWLYNFIECDICIYRPYESSVPAGKYEIYFALDQPYYNYETEMNTFNKAVRKFLEKIDTSKSDAEIIKQIHNRLVDTVTYNTPVAEDGGYWGYCNFAHTAYGALVADSDGNANYAVCDGYSQAMVYLAQQCGINAALIVGIAGPDTSSTGGHAWCVVELDNEWYEIDSTWDDPGSLEESIEYVKNIDPFSYSYFREAFDDANYQNKCRYYLYNLTTKQMTDFVPDDYYYYISKDGRYMYSLVGHSVHIRASENTPGYEDYGLIMRLAPIAMGTKYAVH